MRKGQKLNDWTASEVAFLRENAGILSQQEISYELKRSYWSVFNQAKRLGISLRLYVRKLEWCNTCATWRSTISPKTGKCAVCRKKEQLESAKIRTADAYAQLPAEHRETYDENLAIRTTTFPPRPKKQGSCPVSRYYRSKAEEQYLRDLERWEVACLTRLVDAEKQQTKRMREKTGTNPRKKSNQ